MRERVREREANETNQIRDFNTQTHTHTKSVERHRNINKTGSLEIYKLKFFLLFIK